MTFFSHFFSRPYDVRAYHAALWWEFLHVRLPIMLGIVLSFLLVALRARRHRRHMRRPPLVCSCHWRYKPFQQAAVREPSCDRPCPIHREEKPCT